MALKLALSALVAALVMVTAAPGVAAPADNAAVMATVNQFVDGYNKNDTKMQVTACTSPASIIDEFAPHSWQGPTACADWVRDGAASNRSQGITNTVVTLGRPWQVQVNGNRAYVVVPATFTYKQKGKPQTESGSVFTLALKKTAAGWRIAAWAWAAH